MRYMLFWTWCRVNRRYVRGQLSCNSVVDKKGFDDSVLEFVGDVIQASPPGMSYNHPLLDNYLLKRLLEWDLYWKYASLSDPGIFFNIPSRGCTGIYPRKSFIKSKTKKGTVPLLCGAAETISRSECQILRQWTKGFRDPSTKPRISHNVPPEWEKRNPSKNKKRKTEKRKILMSFQKNYKWIFKSRAYYS